MGVDQNWPLPRTRSRRGGKHLLAPFLDMFFELVGLADEILHAAVLKREDFVADAWRALRTTQSTI